MPRPQRHRYNRGHVTQPRSLKAVQRFRREAEAAPKLHHTNIVPIYGTGEEHGVHFYAMELVEGPSLDRVIRHLRDGHGAGAPSTEPDSTVDSPPPGELPQWVSETMAYSPPSVERPPMPTGTSSDATGSGISSGPQYFDHFAGMMAEVADALQHAHDEGVIHRDTKPSNLLLSPNGRLSLNDFGLARALEQPGMTMSGEFVGSPLYMSPEQITAGRAPLDHRTDVYSLGATLYELLAWQPPFPGRQRDQVIGQILHKDPVPPRRKNRRLPVDLDTMCLKALEKDPDRRYQTAGQMADDLRRYVNRHAISARRIGFAGRSIKWVRRNPLVAAMAILLLAAVTIAGLMAYRQKQFKLKVVQDRALEQALLGNFDQAEACVKEAEQLGAEPGWLRRMRGQVALHRGKYSEAVDHLEQATRLLPGNVATFSMLACAVGESGDEDRAQKMVQELIELQPQKFEDHLFRGYAIGFPLPERSLADLDEAVRLRPESSIAHLARARSRGLYAMEWGDVRDAEGAIEDADAAVACLPNNPRALAERLRSLIIAANSYDELGDSDRASALRARAASDLLRLMKFPNDNDAMVARIQYHFHRENKQALLSEVGKSDQEDELFEVSVLRIATLVRFHKYDEAALRPPAWRSGRC